MSASNPLPRDQLRWVEDHRDDVPNMALLYDKMVNDNSADYYVHAGYARRLHECKRHKITDIAASADGLDIVIQLDGRVDILVWRGTNEHGDTVNALLHSGAPEGAGAGGTSDALTDLGGVRTNFCADEETTRAKLAQLPNGALGILLLDGGTIGYDVTIPPKSIPASKCILYINHSARAAELYCSSAFGHRDEVEAIAECLGLPLVPFV